MQKTVTVSSDTPSGTYTVQACVDSAKVVAETLESDNCEDSTATVTVQGVTVSNADLVVASVTGPPATAFPGDPFFVTAIVENVGTEAAPASTTSFSLVNTATAARKNLKGGQNVAALAPHTTDGPTVTISLYSDTLPGTYKMQACADGPKTFTEAVENNNCTDAAGTITVSAVPNLVVSSIGNLPGGATRRRHQADGPGEKPRERPGRRLAHQVLPHPERWQPEEETERRDERSRAEQGLRLHHPGDADRLRRFDAGNVPRAGLRRQRKGRQGDQRGRQLHDLVGDDPRDGQAGSHHTDGLGQERFSARASRC